MLIEDNEDLLNKIIKGDIRGFYEINLEALYEIWKPNFSIWYSSDSSIYRLSVDYWHCIIQEDQALQIIEDKKLIKCKSRENFYSYDSRETISEKLRKYETELNELLINVIGKAIKQIEYFKKLLGNES